MDRVSAGAEPRVRGRIELQAIFSRALELPAKPEAARLRVRMHRKGELSINGSPVRFAGSEGEAWKEVREGDVAKLLRAGPNRIQAWVRADAGPPALWLALEADGVRLASDTSWTVSLMGAEDAPARLAREPMSALGAHAARSRGARRAQPAAPRRAARARERARRAVRRRQRVRSARGMGSARSADALDALDLRRLARRGSRLGRDVREQPRPARRLGLRPGRTPRLHHGPSCATGTFRSRTKASRCTSRRSSTCSRPVC